MVQLREVIKRSLPGFARAGVRDVRDWLAAPPIEDLVLHDYALVVDPETRPRLSLVLPSISPVKAFGGVTTGVEIFLEIGKRTGADLRILLDDFDRNADFSVVDKCAHRLGIDPTRIEIVPRKGDVPRIAVRSADVFYTYNWWTTLNIRALLREHNRVFGGERKPHLYAIQEYEPLFHPFSSTHMMARLAFEPGWPCWGMFNSREMHDFFLAQGHSVERAFVFEPKLSDGMRPFLTGDAPVKTRCILIYGRPTIARNCYPAIEKGLRLWAERYPEFSAWDVVSAGLPHPPTPFAGNRAVMSLGKLSLEDYAQLLRTTAVGVSLMASPHPSYPPLEMAHFGLRTITNTYANKDLAASHPNILSIGDVAPATIAEALADACRAFEAQPAAGWLAHTRRPSFLRPGPFEFLDEIADALSRNVWRALI